MAGGFSHVKLHDTVPLQASHTVASDSDSGDFDYLASSNLRRRRMILLTIAVIVFVCLAGGCVAIGYLVGDSFAVGGSVTDNPNPFPNDSSSNNNDISTEAPQQNIPTAEAPKTNEPAGKAPIPEPEPVTSPTEAPVTVTSPTLAPVVESAPTDAPVKETVPTEVPLPVQDPTEPSDSGDVTYVPGNLARLEVGLLLSEGLRARIIGETGKPVNYDDKTVSGSSSIPFHGRPDFGATFPDTRPGNEGGWVYVSNSEMEAKGMGGVGALTFDKDGNVIDYKMVLEGTTMNCGGGRTPWNTWMSCEEVEFSGEIYQVDPFGERPAQRATIGSQKGRWESFSYDVRDKEDPKFFATEDHNKGTVRRFRPNKDAIDWDKPWDMMHADGIIDYLIVSPNDERTGGTFEWTNRFEDAKNNARSFYPQSEGIDVYEGIMYVVCKKIKQMFVFNLDDMTYTNQTTVTGLFDGGPDQIQRILDGGNDRDLLYFTEEGGKDAGVHARDELGRFYTIFESPVYPDETTGLAFSPNGMHLYIAYQEVGLLFDIWREDGFPFGARTLNVKYHQTTD